LKVLAHLGQGVSQTLHCMVLPAVPGTKNIKNHRKFIDFAMEVPEVAAVLHPGVKNDPNPAGR